MGEIIGLAKEVCHLYELEHVEAIAKSKAPDVPLEKIAVKVAKLRRGRNLYMRKLIVYRSDTWEKLGVIS